MRHIEPEGSLRKVGFSISARGKLDRAWLYPQTAGQNLSQRRSRDGKTPAVPDKAKALSARLLALGKQVFQTIEDCIRLLQVNPPYMHMLARHR